MVARSEAARDAVTGTAARTLASIIVLAGDIVKDAFSDERIAGAVGEGSADSIETRLASIKKGGQEMTRGAGWATVLSRRASVRWLWPRGWRDPGRKATVLVRFGAAEICFLARIIGRIAGSFHGLVPRVSWKPSKFRIRRYLKPVHLSSRGCAFRFAGQIVRRAARESARPTFGGPVQRPTVPFSLFLSSPPSLRSRTPPRETVRQRAHPHMLAATSTPSRAMLRAPQLRALLRRPAGASASAPPVPLATWRAGRASRLKCSAASDGGRTVTTVDPTKAKGARARASR